MSTSDLNLLAQAVVDRELMLFVGAGASAGASDLPTGDELAQRLAAMLSPEDTRDVVGLPQIASRFEAAMGREALVEEVRSHFRSDPPVAAGSAADWIARLPIDAVVTTNYDALLETAYAGLGITPQQLICRRGRTQRRMSRRELLAWHRAATYRVPEICRLVTNSQSPEQQGLASCYHPRSRLGLPWGTPSNSGRHGYRATSCVGLAGRRHYSRVRRPRPSG